MLTFATQARTKAQAHTAAGTQVGLVAAGATLLAGIVYRTYAIAMPSSAMEITRQLGLVFVAAEIAVILIARHQGLSWSAYWGALRGFHKAALVVFASLFWLSSALVSPLAVISTFLSLTWFVHIAFGVAVHHLFRRVGTQSNDSFSLVLLAGFMALLPMVAIHFAGGPVPISDGSIDWGSSIPGFISERLFGAYAGAMACLAAGLLWKSDHKKSSLTIGYVVLTVCLSAAFWSGTRAAILGICFAGLMGYMTTRRVPPRRLVLLFPLCCVMALALALPIAPNDPGFQLYATGDYSSAEAASAGRMTLWLNAWNAFAGEPWLGGGSAANFWLPPIGDAHHVQPHNAVLQFLMSWGLPASAAALILLGCATWEAHRRVRLHQNLLPVLMMLDCLLVISLVDGMLYFPRFVMLIVSALAICLAAPDDKQTGAPNQR